MKPHWDTLMSTYADSKSVLIADVDCTAGGKSLCEKHGVQGYPTIKYGEPTALQDYQGGRELKDLEKFASENLGPTCGPDNLDLCDATDKKFIEKFKKWDIDELDMSIEEKEAKVNKIEAAGKKEVDKKNKEISNLNDKIEKEGTKKDKAIEKAKKEANYGYLKAVKASRSPKVDPDEDPDLADDSADDKKEDL